MQVTRYGLVSGPLAEWWSHKIDQLRHSPRPDRQDAQSPSDLNSTHNNRWTVRKDHLKAARPPTPHATKVQCTICNRMGHDASTCWLNPNYVKGKGKGKGKSQQWGGAQPRNVGRYSAYQAAVKRGHTSCPW